MWLVPQVTRMTYHKSSKLESSVFNISVFRAHQHKLFVHTNKRLALITEKLFMSFHLQTFPSRILLLRTPQYIQQRLLLHFRSVSYIELCNFAHIHRRDVCNKTWPSIVLVSEGEKRFSRSLTTLYVCGFLPRMLIHARKHFSTAAVESSGFGVE